MYVSNKLVGCLATLSVVALTACEPIDMAADRQLSYNPTDVTGTLKEAADFPVGVAIAYDLMKNDPRYAALVKSEFDNVTFEYQMKHGAMVRNNGTIDFTRTDELVNLVGMPVYGHVLAWHQNNNGDYLRSLASTAVSSNPVNLIENGDFEAGSGNTFTNWNNLVGGNAVGTYSAETADVEPNTGSRRALRVTVTTPGANAYDMQSLGPSFTAVAGRQYRVSVSVKALSGSGQFKLVLQNTAYTENQLTFSTNAWATYVWNVTVGETNPQLKLHFNGAGTYLIDNVKVEDASAGAPPTSGQVATRVDNALKTWIQAMVGRYKDKVRAWDVVNEPYTDGAVFRTGASTGDTYYWAQFMGRSYVAKAFTYANQADPTADLFINDYNLESNAAKLDSIIGLVKELQAQKVPITGIGTQMHVNWNTSYAGIESMFKKLAATGLKIKITELDVRVNPNNVTDFQNSPQWLDYQAAMYNYIINSYIRNVPANQRYGVTVWNVTDKDSWIVLSQGRTDFPTLWDKDYNKKPAYAGMLKGLQGKE
ncbi:hypothetical protein F5984_12230 [Rudanella paleaurantiibacter]|uniref:Beta-xylanase n=1 Tax=Rudanella paleaurantiibacter TaxID=2614655 RepID=A0A7J5TXS8_9BACT|nr:endo-1,4-beta-xylanase [Rudanella paleaurantiibacter]KAB7729948.1 hypothetical protein F5984_12230 [Rudanella paleaurantiibacter]